MNTIIKNLENQEVPIELLDIDIQEDIMNTDISNNILVKELKKYLKIGESIRNKMDKNVNQ